MLTFEKVQTYQKYKGDIDGFSRATMAGVKDLSGITDEEWFLISDIVGSLILMNSGYAAPSFITSTEQRLIESTKDNLCRNALHTLAKTPPIV